MNDKEVIRMKDLGGGDLLVGAAAGLAIQQKALERLESKRPKVGMLDFSGVQIASASLLREVVFGTRDAARRAGLDVQITISNANSAIEEELRLVARALGTSVVHVESNNPQSKAKVIGDLDEVQGRTLDMVISLGEATASDLQSKDPDVKLTAWNNRLAALVERGLLVEGKKDRHKLFRPVTKGLSYGR